MYGLFSEGWGLIDCAQMVLSDLFESILDSNPLLSIFLESPDRCIWDQAHCIPTDMVHDIHLKLRVCPFQDVSLMKDYLLGLLKGLSTSWMIMMLRMPFGKTYFSAFIAYKFHFGCKIQN